MKIYDISRNPFLTKVYPGDPEPRVELFQRMEMGDEYNLSGFFMCAHTATHMDAPRHFLQDGNTIESTPLENCIGPCTVVTASGLITGGDIDRLLPTCENRILFKGNGKAFLSQSGAFACADAGILLVGTDAQSIGAYEQERQPHCELLSAGIPILEGLDLSQVPDGRYELVALPLKLTGLEAAPVRAVLLA